MFWALIWSGAVEGGMAPGMDWMWMGVLRDWNFFFSTWDIIIFV